MRYVIIIKEQLLQTLAIVFMKCRVLSSEHAMKGESGQLMSRSTDYLACDSYAGRTMT